MAGYKKNNNGPSAEDKALDQFADLMIEKIQSIEKDWTKPWFTEGALQWPKNLSGREYNGMNALLLLMHCEKNGYTIPRFCTFDCVQRMNQTGEKKKGEEQPRVSVLKGEHSFPVMLTTFTVVDKDTKEKIKYEDYKNLSNEEKQQYNVYPKLNVFRVFNVAQTNLKEARPELWAKLEAEYSKPQLQEGEQFSFQPVDSMIQENRWICPIKPMHQDNAYYSISKNEIVVPEKGQFVDGESFYGTLFHEMTHSTGKEGVLDRIKPAAFGSEEYAREELVAELGSALVAQRYGMAKHIKEDSASYLKSWLESLKESPQFIKTALLDVKKATSIITQRIDQIAQELETKQEKEKVIEHVQEEKPMYFASVAYLQSADDTILLDRLMENDDFERLLQETKEYDQGDAIDLENTHATATPNRNDTILVEDEHYAVVYNASVGGTYDIQRKVSEQEVRDTITRYGLPERPTPDVKRVAQQMVKEELATLSKDRELAFEMPNGEVLYFEYDIKNDCVNVGSVTNAGLATSHAFSYDHSESLTKNLEMVHERLEELPEYQEQELEETAVYHRSR